MNVAGQDELDFRQPLLHGFSLGLRSFVVGLEVVGKVAIQVEPTGIVPAYVTTSKLVLRQ